jgi:hypothetical protein
VSDSSFTLAPLIRSKRAFSMWFLAAAECSAVSPFLLASVTQSRDYCAVNAQNLNSLGLFVDIGAVLEKHLCDLYVVHLRSQVQRRLLLPVSYVTPLPSCAAPPQPHTVAARASYKPLALGSAPLLSRSAAMSTWFLNDAECSAVQPSLCQCVGTAQHSAARLLTLWCLRRWHHARAVA